jgi:hypothetical protein
VLTFKLDKQGGKRGGLEDFEILKILFSNILIPGDVL